MTYGITLSNGDPLPSFITYDPISRNMTITPDFTSGGEWLITYTVNDGVSPADHIAFIIDVQCKFGK